MITDPTLAKLATRWRTTVAILKEYGALEAAAFWELAANKIDEFSLEVLSVPDVAKEAGVSEDTARLAIKEGRVENAAEGGRIGIRRQDIPKLRKPRNLKKTVPQLPSGDRDMVAEVEAAGGLRVS